MKSARILIADDDPDARAIVRLGVEALGLSYVEAEDGNKAWQLFQEHTPDLAILDRMMPGLSGTDVCRKIKGDSHGLHVPVILLTACDGLQDKVDAFSDGVDDYLTKPFHLEELQARLKALLRVRELTLKLQEKNEQLIMVQDQLIKHERQLLVGQLAGTAAHQLGQPLSAIMLNCHLIEKLPATDERYQKALQAIKQDAKRMAELIEQLKSADASKTESYHGKTAILDISK